MKNQLPTDKNGYVVDAMQYEESVSGGGDIYAGIIMNNNVSAYRKVEETSHELFHAYQYENGQGGAVSSFKTGGGEMPPTCTTNILKEDQIK